jgi:hypothetical protein
MARFPPLLPICLPNILCWQSAGGKYSGSHTIIKHPITKHGLFIQSKEVYSPGRVYFKH